MGHPPERPRAYLGIDPGNSGGLALVWGDEAETWKMPATDADLVDLFQDVSVILSPWPSFVVLEKVGAMPNQGVTSMFNFGRNYGLIQGILHSHHLPFELVAPGRWQAALSCRSGGDKNVTKRRAQELFPQVKKITHATADALLLAEYGRRNRLGVG